MTTLPRAAHAPRPILTTGLLAMTLVVATASVALARPVPQSFADLAEQVAPAVVDISTVQETGGTMRPGRDGEALPLPPGGPFPEFFERFFDRDGPARPGRSGRPVTAVGSGFVLDPAGYVVTNNHVVAKAAEITVTLKDGRAFEADLIGRDEKTDLALLKIGAEKPLPHVRLGDSDEVRVGDWVMAVGNPFGLGGTVTAGIVSARGRDLAGGALIDFLQIDAAINRGNSGGPAFNGAGEVIGINTAIFSPNGGSVGIGFAIPSNLVRQVVAELREHGRVERGWLGVRIQPVGPEIAEGLGLDEPRGALIASLEAGGPAARAGLEAGDVVLSWDGKNVARLKDLPRLVANTPAGRTIEVTVWRGRDEKTLTVVTGRIPGTGRVAARGGRSNPASDAEVVEGTGLTVASLAPGLRERYGIAESVPGVLVVAVEPGSAAAKQGLRVGDLITSVALQPVRTAGEAAEQLARLRREGRPVAMLMVSRRGTNSFFALRLAKA